MSKKSKSLWNTIPSEPIQRVSRATINLNRPSHSLKPLTAQGCWSMEKYFSIFSDSFRNRKGMKVIIGMCMHQGHRKMIQNIIFWYNLEISQMSWLRATFCGFLVESLWKKFLKQKPPHPIFDLLARPKTSYDLWRKQLWLKPDFIKAKRRDLNIKSSGPPKNFISDEIILTENQIL